MQLDEAADVRSGITKCVASSTKAISSLGEAWPIDLLQAVGARDAVHLT